MLGPPHRIEGNIYNSNAINPALREEGRVVLMAWQAVLLHHVHIQGVDPTCFSRLSKRRAVGAHVLLPPPIEARLTRHRQPANDRARGGLSLSSLNTGGPSHYRAPGTMVLSTSWANGERQDKRHSP